MGGKSRIDLAFVLDLDNYRNSLRKWLCCQGKENHEQLYFNQYLPIVKPIVHRFVTITNLDPQNISFHTSLSQAQIKVLTSIYKPLQSFNIVPDIPPNQLPNEDFSYLLQPPLTNLTRLELMSVPRNEQFGYWSYKIMVPKQTISGPVIQGKGVGAKELGMPTANVRMVNESALGQYPNGIYEADFRFRQACKQFQGLAYAGVASLGTNPHYENLKEGRVLEVYVKHDFGDTTFYGAIVDVTLLRLIRLEGKFLTFDSFLNAMHNDIWSAKDTIDSSL